ncbi:hypothetical protein [uncultured Sphingomonas sp.]|uniref:hypothetical protein n=1 Tax=uncultured Sphingomonas sp. TaxID=158754 RepID=UPI0035C9C341
MAFGDLVLLRSDLELDRRRVSPITLQRSDYHRMAWLNVMLPYCPESLERLMDSCPRCHERLGWRTTFGIGWCEHCERELPPSCEAALPSELAEEYRFFASLASTDPEHRAGAVARLPTRLRQLAPAELIRLVLRVGWICRDEPLGRTMQKEFVRFAPELRASIITTGTDLLKDWPDGIRGWAMAQSQRYADDIDGYTKLRYCLKRIGNGNSVAGQQRELMAETFPDLFKSFGHGFAGSERYYLTAQVAPMLGIPVNRLARLRQAGCMDYTELPSRKERLRIRYDADQVDRIANALRGSCSIASCTGAVGLPSYAIEQMVCMGVLEQEVHPAVLLLHDRPRVRRASVELTLERLRACYRKDPPHGLMPLKLAANRIGGRLKPWGTMYVAMLSGDLPIWHRKEARSPLRAILVRPESLAMFDDVHFDSHDYPDFLFDTLATSVDIGEILNVAPKVVHQIIADGGLARVIRDTAHCVAAAEVLAMAARLASNSEVGHWNGESVIGTHYKLMRLSIPGEHGMWSRNALKLSGIL